MTLLPKAPIDLSLAPVAVHLDMNLAQIRDASPDEISFHVALELDRPEAPAPPRSACSAFSQRRCATSTFTDGRRRSPTTTVACT